MLKFFLETSIFQILELAAAISGTIYLKRVNPKDATKYLVYFLWFIFFVELLAGYTAVAYFSDYEYFGFIEDTPFRRNYWLYNIAGIVEFFTYIYFFSSNLVFRVLRKVVSVLLVLFVGSTILHYFLGDWFFRAHSPYLLISGSLVLFTTVGFYYLEILRSNRILYFHKLLPFYISIGVMVFFICVTPLFIYSSYYTSGNTTYQLLNSVVLYITNVIMYGIYTYGFLKLSKSTK